MAKNITLLGASYSDVPAVDLPQTGGGTARFTDTSPTTATASDVASGKIFFLADGTQETGTASGGGGTGGITQDSNGYLVLDEEGGGGGGGGGGATNFVQGEFHTDASGDVIQTVNIPYTGSGYPISVVVVLKEGLGGTNSTWPSLVERYAVGYWTCSKLNPNVAPTYDTGYSDDGDKAAVMAQYKSSASGTSISNAGSTGHTLYGTDDPSDYYGYSMIEITSNTQFKCIVRNTVKAYGLRKNTDYFYYIVYSS